MTDEGIPQVKVENETVTVRTSEGMASTVAVIGAFKSNITTPTVYNNLREAKAALGDDSTFNGCKVLDKLFMNWSSTYGASNIIVVNTATSTTSGETTTWDKEITSTKLATALSSIKGENYDILFIADNLDDAGFTAIKTFEDSEYDLQKPIGLVAPLVRDNTTASIATANIFNTGGLFGLINQQYKSKYYDNNLDVIESAAYYTGILCGLKVNQSMTMKELPGVTGLVTEYGFDTGEDGRLLMNAGITLAKILDRINNKVYIVKTLLPNGHDVSTERAVNYMIKGFQLVDFLGDPSNTKSLSSIEGEVESRKQTYLEMDLANDISATVTKVSATCIDIELLFTMPGIITLIDVKVSVEVE